METQQDDKNDMLTRAILLATTEHGRINQVRKGSGLPYIIHPLAVMETVTTIDEKIVAVLHDIVEDVDGFELLDLDFPQYIVDAVDAITHRKGKETREQYLDRVKSNKIALNVKYADIMHNLSDMTNIPKSTRDIWFKKYRDTLNYLE